MSLRFAGDVDVNLAILVGLTKGVSSEGF